jgi:hypothetical protein
MRLHFSPFFSEIGSPKPQRLVYQVETTKAPEKIGPKSTTEVPKDIQNASETNDKTLKDIEGRQEKAENDGSDVMQKSWEKVDAKLKTLQASPDDLSSEQLSDMARKTPELVLGLANQLQDHPELVVEAFQNAVESNPASALAFNFVYNSSDRYPMIQKAIGNALRQGDPRTAAGYSYLLKPNDAAALKTVITKVDPSSLRLFR